MGITDNNEPPSKRAKPSMERSASNLDDSSSLKNSIAGSTSNLMARDLVSQGNQETIGSKGLIKKTEFIRVIAAALNSLGYEESAAHVEKESGIPLQSSIVKSFIQQVRDENWDGSVATLHQIDLLDETVVQSASLLLLEQKFFQLISAKRDKDALSTLQNEMFPLCTTSQHRDYSSCIISLTGCKDLGFYNEDTGFAAYRSKILERLKKILPPEVVVPENRLVQLIDQTLDLQRDTCTFHNCYDNELSLYSDHNCRKSRIPSQTLQTLQEHTDEVWSLQFSHEGRYLASGSKDKSAVIWEVDENGQVLLKYRLCGHQKPVSAVLWSPDDCMLLTCGLEEVIRSWDMSSGNCLQIFEKPGIGVLSCEWHPNGTRIYSGMMDKSICAWDLNGGEVESWTDPQFTIGISDMAITQDGKTILTRSKDTEISMFDMETNQNRVLITEDDLITSFSISKYNDNLVLVSLFNQRIHLRCIKGTRADLVRGPADDAVYHGHKRERFIVRSCLGGFKEGFIASGSEDSQVYIWDRRTTELIFALPGHAGSVTCVSWNPKNLDMLASAGDDSTIRIWGSSHIMPKAK